MMSAPTPSQAKALAYFDDCVKVGKRPFILWYGGIRAGKTWGAADIAMKHRTMNIGKLYIVGGVTVRSIFTNIAPYFKEMADAQGLKYKESRGALFPRMEIGENTFAIYGGEKQGSDRKIQGSTAAGLILDEYELLDRMFVKQCENRISVPGALRIYTSNKDNPYNWASREYYRKALRGDLDCLLLDVPTNDNQHLDQGFVSEKLAEMDDGLRRRFIDNEFVLPFTPIYKPQVMDWVPADTIPDLLAVYAYGISCVDIPFYREGSEWMVGECETYPAPLEWGDVRPAKQYLVNSTARRLAKDIQANGGRVRGYSPMFDEYRLELCQRAFARGNVALTETAEILNEHIEQYHNPGMYLQSYLTALESGIEYVERVSKW